MPVPPGSLPPQVLAALRRGGIVEAIKLLRDDNGAGLKQAREAIVAYLRDTAAGGQPNASNTSAAAKPAPPSTTRAPATTGLPPSVVEAMQQGQKLEAIKRLREQTGLGLKDAKDAVESYGMQLNLGQNGYSPGEVPRSEGAGWWVVILAMLALAGYYFFRDI